MALTYTQAKATLDEIADRSERNRQLLERARNLIAQAETDLSNMPTEYGPFVTELNAAASAAPGDAAWQGAKAEKDHMVADFQALRTRATSLKTAYDSVT